MCWTWFCAVRSEITSRRAIWRFVMPSVTSDATSCSRLLSSTVVNAVNPNSPYAKIAPELLLDRDLSYKVVGKYQDAQGNLHAVLEVLAPDDPKQKQ